MIVIVPHFIFYEREWKKYLKEKPKRADLYLQYATILTRHCRLMICKHRGIYNLWGTKWNLFGKSLMDWLRVMIWTKTYMYTMIQKARGRFIFNQKTLMDYGAKVSLFPGVDTWLKRIREYGETKGVIVEHYIISSGLKEMIEGTKVANEFEKIYASSFYYDENGEAKWPAQVINYTSKTQFLFRIVKGTLDVNDSGVNDYFNPEDIRIPFRNMVYIGDSDTDIPCMKLVNSHSSHSIGVYNPETRDRRKVYKMMEDKRIKYFAPADYTDNSELDKLVKAIIDQTASNEKLMSVHFQCKQEQVDHNMNIDSHEDREKQKLILDLENSNSFKQTHSVISKLKQIKNWTRREKIQLQEIAKTNNQVSYIIDDDVDEFYKLISAD